MLHAFANAPIHMLLSEDQDVIEARLRISVHCPGIFQAFSDLTHSKVIFALTQGERSVNEIAQMVGASPSSVSHHLHRLRDMGLVEYHRHGNKILAHP